MTTKNPRLSVTLQPGVIAVLQRLSAVTEKSQSSLVGELLEQSVPVFERMVSVLEAAKQSQEHLHAPLVESLARAQAKLESQLGLALDTMDEGFQPILDAEKGISRRSPRACSVGAASVRREGSEGGSTPVPVTRGSGRVRKAQKGVSRGSL